MKKIEHLPEEEKKHFTRCDCGEWVDMRDLADVFNHLHVKNTPKAHWSHSRMLGEPAAWPSSGGRIDLN